MRAASIHHVEHDILMHMVTEIDLNHLKNILATDKVSTERFDKGAANVMKLLDKLISTRQKHLPEGHVEA